jgi:diguanylate cyclase (GGDEF)-like protein
MIMSAQVTMNQIKDRMPPISTKTKQETPVAAASGSNIDSNYNRVLEVSHILHSSLEAEEILRKFTIEVSKEISIDGLIFVNSDEQLEVHIGNLERHSLEYTISLHDSRLGQLQMSRVKPFSDTEITTLEYFTTALIYPLHNAFSYARAIRSSFQDPLTGISNRAALQRDLEREVALASRTGSPLSLLLLDIDHFKQVNDQHGHQSGDQALKAVASSITDSTRGSDMQYRYGGDEFLVLLACTPAEGAELVAECIRSNIETLLIDSDKDNFNITASIGVSTLCEGDNAESLVRRADEALYQAKHDGRNLMVRAE